MGETFGEDDRLVLAGRIGELDDAELGARFGAPLGAIEHAGGKARRGRAAAHGARKIGPALDAQAGQHALVGLERMTGKKEADGLEFAAQAIGGRPRGAARLQRRAVAVAEQRALSGGLFLNGAVGERQRRLHRGEGDRPIGLEFVEGARGGETFQRLLVDHARVDAPRHVGERGERACPARRHDRLGLRFADPLDRRKRISDRQRVARRRGGRRNRRSSR